MVVTNAHDGQLLALPKLCWDGSTYARVGMNGAAHTHPTRAPQLPYYSNAHVGGLCHWHYVASRTSGLAPAHITPAATSLTAIPAG